MKINKMGNNYLVICNDQGQTLAFVDMDMGTVNPSISFLSTISLWDARGVMWQIEEYLKQKKP